MNAEPDGADGERGVTSSLQLLRCYTVPQASRAGRVGRDARHPHERKGRKSHQQEQQGKRATDGLGEMRLAFSHLAAPYGGFCLVFDLETTKDKAQLVRFGAYRVYGVKHDARMLLTRFASLGTLMPEQVRAQLDTLVEAGVFYDPDACTPDEVALLKDYAAAHGMACWTREQFVTGIFYPWAYTRRALVIGHNLPFDLTRLARAWHEGRGRFANGFAFTLCDCRGKDGTPYRQCAKHPAVRVKSLGFGKALYAFATPAPLRGHPQYQSREARIHRRGG